MAKDTIIKKYKGKRTRAEELYQYDLLRMAKKGYVPDRKAYEAGAWGGGKMLATKRSVFPSRAEHVVRNYLPKNVENSCY